MAISVKKAFHKAVEAFRICWKRFPVTVFFLCALTAHYLYFIANEWKKEEALQIALTYYFTVGTLLSLTLHLWSEEVKNLRLKLTVQGVAHALLFADAAYVYHLIRAEAFFVETGLAHASILFALTIALFYLPFWREKNDVASNKFAQRLIGSFVVTQLVGLLFWGGLSLLLSSLKELFGIHISPKCYSYIGTLCCILLAPMIFLGLLPQDGQKHDHTPQPSIFWNNALRYLFLPLTAGYLAVLYAYAARILVTWELPNGWVSGLVTALMALTIALQFGLYSVRLKENRRLDQRIAHLLPLLVLPLLVLMTVGIARRISDYGITLNRLYLATLNGWFYLVCIGLAINKARRIHWLPLSFAGLFLLTSALPVNYAAISRSYLLRKVETQIESTYQCKLPMSDEQYLDWLKTLPEEVALTVNSRLKELDNFYRDKNIQRFVSNDVSYWEADNYIKEDTITLETITKGEVTITGEDGEEETIAIGKYYVSTLSKEINPVDISEGYTGLVLYANVRDTFDLQVLKSDTLAFALHTNENEEATDTAYVALQDLQKWDKLHNLPPQALRCNSVGDKFMLTYFILDINTLDSKRPTEFTFSGIHLKK